MNKSSTPANSNQKAKGNAAAASVTQKPTAKSTKNKTTSGVAVSAMPSKAAGPVTTTDAPMHAAKGNDDTMSQPQASKMGKKNP